MITRFLILLLVCVSSAFASAEKARAALEKTVRAEVMVPITLRPIKEEGVSAAQLASINERRARDWAEFLRKCTTEHPSTQTHRRLTGDAFWREFFGRAYSDGIMRAAGIRPMGELKNALKTQRAIAALDPSDSLRAEMVTRIDAAERDVLAWVEDGRDSSGARFRMAQSIKALIAPLPVVPAPAS